MTFQARRTVHLSLLAFTLAAFAVGAGRAQVLYGTLVGNVTDPGERRNP